MKLRKPTRTQVLAGVLIIFALLAWGVASQLPPREPVWQGHRLSEWLDAFDRNLRWNPPDERRSKFTDDQIAAALDGIGTNALPTLHYWITGKPGQLKARINRLLDRQRWIKFRFENANQDFRDLAFTAIMYYAQATQPLLPDLLKLTHSQDTIERMWGFTAAFFTRPDKQTFMELSNRILADKDDTLHATVAQWMAERFPGDAIKLRLRERFPVYFDTNRFSEAIATDR